MSDIPLIEALSIATQIVSALAILLAVLFTTNFLREQRTRSREEVTVKILSDYRDRMVLPLRALKSINPDDAFHSSEIPSDHEGIKSLLTYLNDMEFICLLVNNQTISEKICKQFLRGTIIRGFDRMFPYVNAYRTSSGNSKLYVEFESLARRWDR